MGPPFPGKYRTRRKCQVDEVPTSADVANTPGEAKFHGLILYRLGERSFTAISRVRFPVGPPFNSPYNAH